MAILDQIPATGQWLPGALAMLEAATERCYERIFVELPGWLLDGGHRYYWVYLASFVVLGAVAYRRHYRRTLATSASLFSFLFPREVYRHPSALLDYKLLLMNRLLGPSALMSRVLLGSVSIAFVATLTQEFLLELAGGGHAPAPWSFGSLAAFVLCIALVRDFSTYVTHALHHRIPLLWEFHKVHHSAEVLTPLTVYRKHPVYNLFSTLADIAIVAPFQGLVAFLFAGPAEPMTLFGANVVFSLFHILGANLRHSHIWFAFGPRLSHVLISPAQHQIHHSKATRHWNRNYGEVFALWDWLFGTLYVPGPEREVLEFGIAGAERQEHATLLQAYFVPFANCARLIRGYLGRLLPASPGTRRASLPSE